MQGYFKGFVSILVAVAVLVLVTGLLILPTMLDLRLEWDVPWRLDVSDRVWVVALHTLFGFVIVAMVGMLWPIHMRLGWRKRKQIISGLTLVTSFILMMLTAVGIYYFGDEDLSLASSVLHVLFATLGTGYFTYHAIKGFLSRSRN